jgi:hypothetical protein
MISLNEPMAGPDVPRCIAYNDQGKICGRPATVIDLQRGGMVCFEHAPKQPAKAEAKRNGHNREAL